MSVLTSVDVAINELLLQFLYAKEFMLYNYALDLIPADK